MFWLSCCWVKFCIDVANHSKGFLTMFWIYYKNIIWNEPNFLVSWWDSISHFNGWWLFTKVKYGLPNKQHWNMAIAQSIAKHSTPYELYFTFVWLLNQIAQTTINFQSSSSSCVMTIKSPKTLKFVCNWKGWLRMGFLIKIVVELNLAFNS